LNPDYALEKCTAQFGINTLSELRLNLGELCVKKLFNAEIAEIAEKDAEFAEKNSTRLHIKSSIA